MSAYQILCASYIEMLTSDPNTCVTLGLEQRLDELPDPTLAGLSREHAQAAALREEAERLAPTLPDFHERLDAELIALAARQRELESSLTFNGRLQAQQLPDAAETISEGIFLLVTNDPRTPEQRLHNIRARLERVPTFLEETLQRLDTPVERWVSIECESIEGLPEFFSSIVSWAEETEFSDIDALRGAVDNAQQALADYAQKLRALPTTRSFALGAGQAQTLIASRGIELSLEDIHQIAREFVTETRAQIESVRSVLVAKYDLPRDMPTSDLQRFLAQKYAVDAADGDLQNVIARYQETATQLESFVRERALFPIPEQQAITIMRTPAFMAPMIPAGAMMPPAALRDGVKTSTVYLTLSEALLDEHTELGIPLMMLHEGIPGHHLQLATASMHESVVRRTFSANEHAEGWTTMLEDYMLDQNLMGELTDEARFVTKLDLSRIGARVAIDLYFMTGERAYLDIGYDISFSSDDPFENAAQLLIAATGFTPGRAQAELNWYSQARAYPLSYLVGNRLAWALKAEVQQATAHTLSSDEQDRLFHRIYLESGNMPVAFLQRVFDRVLGQTL